MWSPKTAESRIHAYAKQPNIELAYTDHAQERMVERDINGADILHILKYGHIHDEPEPADEPGLYKYKMCARTPDSSSRTICAVVIPSVRKAAVKIITAMWEDLR